MKIVYGGYHTAGQFATISISNMLGSIVAENTHFKDAPRTRLVDTSWPPSKLSTEEVYGWIIYVGAGFKWYSNEP